MKEQYRIIMSLPFQTVFCSRTYSSLEMVVKHFQSQKNQEVKGICKRVPFRSKDGLERVLYTDYSVWSNEVKDMANLKEIEKSFR